MTVRTAALAPCAVRHVDLDAPAAALAPGAGENAILALYWRGGRPMGFRVLVAGETPVPAAAAAVLAADACAPALAAEDAAHEAADEPRAPAPAADATAGEAAGGTPPRISVVICTRDRPQDLARCLASLARCAPAPHEILVVDNAPEGEATAETVAAFPGMRYLREPRPGLSRARNAGLRAATGEVVAFTDDDVEVRPDWIARLGRAFAEPGIACVTGYVAPANLATEAACLFELEIGGFGRVFAPRRFDAGYLRQGWWRAPDVWKIGAGANMAIRRDAFARVGPFDERLGAGASGCSEDSEFWFRLLHAGLACRYDPETVVFHHHRSDRAGLTRQMRAYARGHVVALFVQFAQDRRACHMIRAFAVMPWFYVRTAFRALVRGDRDRLALILPQLAGCLEGPLAAARWLRRPRWTEGAAPIGDTA